MAYALNEVLNALQENMIPYVMRSLQHGFAGSWRGLQLSPTPDKGISHMFIRA